MVPPSQCYCALTVLGLQWYMGGGTGLQGKELGNWTANKGVYCP